MIVPVRPVFRGSDRRAGALITTIALAMATALLLGSVAGCARRDDARSEAEVRSAITEYDRLLAEGYRIRNMSGLSSVATTNQAYTEYLHMASLGEAGVTLESTLTALDFLRVAVSDEGTASADTRESWTYRQVGARGATTAEETRVVYELTYELVKSEDIWKVNWVFETANPRRPPEEGSETSAAPTAGR